MAPSGVDLSLAQPHLLPLCTLQARPESLSFITAWHEAAVCVTPSLLLQISDHWAVKEIKMCPQLQLSITVKLQDCCFSTLPGVKSTMSNQSATESSFSQSKEIEILLSFPSYIVDITFLPCNEQRSLSHHNSSHLIHIQIKTMKQTCWDVKMNPIKPLVSYDCCCYLGGTHTA